MSKRYALVTGASGLLGTQLIPVLKNRGYTVIGLAHQHRPDTDVVINDPAEVADISQHLHLVVNLAGLPIMGRPWTRGYKSRLRESRIGLTEHLIGALHQQGITCDHFISGSAIGYYGATEEDCHEDQPAGDDFSARLCADWEQAAKTAEKLGAIVTIVRTGLVLSKTGGFLEPFRLPTRCGMRMVFGDGQQWLSWIDYRDWLCALEFIIEKHARGTFNLTAPEPERQAGFSKTLVANRPVAIPIPLPRFVFYPLGEMKTLLIDGQKAAPSHLLKLGYEFQYPTLNASLADLPFPA
ncbi:TIGR01777 family oxidoreductase [Reinekea blandensis]|uniref:TIGR01777 family protein n=1 Tax=Reinekea blandensis MED297 TaxID=314283 RepID=A4BGN5_9GAMM|nr:TIGR01777 family oxidoreductase [Reinekea blandensis]EAR08683.1 hypothetical protein MED297_14245 [Reinekea sp. MED297] [Reinekea blandensis MED297]